MLSSLIKNCKDFFYNRPPFVIFLLCLITLAITTLSFGFYVKATENLINTDAQRNWLRLAEFMRTTEICSDTKFIDTSTIEETNFTTFITVDLGQLRQFKRIQSVFYLKDWHQSCPEDFDTFPTIIIDFNPPIRNRTGSNEVETICALVRGPKQYLPKYSKSLCDFNLNQYDNSRKSMIFSNIINNNYTKCSTIQNSTIIKTRLLINGNHNSENFAIYLNENDRILIFNHLIYCTLILFLLICFILIYAMLQKWEE